MQNSNIKPRIPTIFLELLKQRGIEGEGAVNKFLFPNLRDLPKPEIMKNLPEAARLIADYIERGEKIIIWGDYDVDGTTGTALLVNFFDALGVQCKWHIPNRLSEGYGLNCDWFFDQKNIQSPGDDFLLITVDCGISDFEPIEKIKKIGGKVIVTDHHSLPDRSLPDCLILNPSQKDCGFHEEKLAGVGVAFYLAAGVRAELSSRSLTADYAKAINLKQFLSFVALGTVADLVEQTHTNRILIRAGFEALSNTSFIGLKELLDSSEITGGSISSEDIGFLIGPKINAAGRLGESNIVVNLLTAKDHKKAKKLERELNSLNIKRRRISDENLETALSLLGVMEIEHSKCVIACGMFHQGVAGIVASRLVDLFKVPAIVFAELKESDGSFKYVGSARSVEGVNIIKLLKKCSALIEKFGGHEMAAGLTVVGENITIFKEKFIAVVKDKIAEKTKLSQKKWDICCPVGLLMDPDNIAFLKFLEPFGTGNPQPVFMDPAAKIIDTRKVGRNGEHVHLTVRGDNANHKGIGFGLGERIADIQSKPERTLVYTPTINRFRGTTSWQVRVIDI